MLAPSATNFIMKSFNNSCCVSHPPGHALKCPSVVLHPPGGHVGSRDYSLAAKLTPTHSPVFTSLKVTPLCCFRVSFRLEWPASRRIPRLAAMLVLRGGSGGPSDPLRLTRHPNKLRCPRASVDGKWKRARHQSHMASQREKERQAVQNNPVNRTQ